MTTFVDPLTMNNCQLLSKRKRRKICRTRRIVNVTTINSILVFGGQLLVVFSLFDSPSLTTAKLPAHLVSYTTMMGLAAQSSRWKHAMEAELAQVAKLSAQAAAWQEAALDDKAASDALTKTSLAEQEQAELLQEEGDSLLEKGEADEARATTTEEEADGLTVEASETEVEASALFAEVGVEEAEVVEDTTKATKNAALAAEDGTAAEADEAATAVCQFIPLVDVVCDVVGGIAAVGLETATVRSAALAAEEYGAAAAAQVKSNSLRAEASDLQATAIEEEEEAAALHGKAAEFEAQASEKIEEGEADKAAAEEELEKSAADKEVAAEEETKSVAEEEFSAEAWSESVQHGAQACANAIMMSAVSVIALLFWATRIAGSAILPIVRSFLIALWNLLLPGGTPGRGTCTLVFLTSEVIPTISHVFHHGFFFVVCFGLYGETLLQLRNFGSVQAMGGIILGFAAGVASAQIILLHAIPRANRHQGSFQSSLWAGLYETLRWSISLCPLVVMEILLLWVNAGTKVFSQNVVRWAQSWWLWVILPVTLIAHYCLLCRLKRGSVETEAAGSTENHVESDNELVDDESRQRLLTQTGLSDTFAHYGSRDTYQVEEPEAEHWEPIEARDDFESTEHLLSGSSCDSQAQLTTSKQHQEKGFLALVFEDIARLRLVLVFEVLMASIMLALLRQSAPMLRNLWPASKAVLLSAHPHWHWIIPMAAVMVIAVLGLACL